MKELLKTFTLDEVNDKYIGKIGTPKRDAFEQELKMEILGNAIKKARQERNLTQEQLGKKPLARECRGFYMSRVCGIMAYLNS